jgi:hypothetical protein
MVGAIATGHAVRNPILFLAANPAETTELALAEECRGIEREVRATELRDLINFQPRLAVTPMDMLRHLDETRPVIAHFSGHGTPAGLVLNSEDDGSRVLSPDSLRTVLASAGTSVRVVVLNACYSAGLAHELTEVVDHVIGMSGLVHDRAARQFAIAFYCALGNGRDLENAVAQGRAALASAGPIAAWQGETSNDAGCRDVEDPTSERTPEIDQLQHAVRRGVSRNAYVLDPLVDEPYDVAVERLIHNSTVDFELHERLVRHARFSGRADPLVAVLRHVLGRKPDATERYWMYRTLGRIGTAAAREALGAITESEELAAIGLQEARNMTNH